MPKEEQIFIVRLSAWERICPKELFLYRFQVVNSGVMLNWQDLHEPRLFIFLELPDHYGFIMGFIRNDPVLTP